MRSLKTATAVRANHRLSKTGEAFWPREHYDRWLRSDKKLASVVGYVESDPVKGGLATCSEEWPWSSAWNRTGGKTASAPGLIQIADEMYKP